MKANELSKILRQTATLLDMYDDKDIQYVLSDLTKLKSKNLEKRSETPRRKTQTEQFDKAKLSDLSNWLRNATLEEVQNSIEVDSFFKSGQNVRALANLIGLSVSTRQSRDALIQTLLSHLDRTRMHRTISERDRSVDEPSRSSDTSAEEIEQPSEGTIRKSE
ncbi:hypothetical protein BKM17_21585 [Pseudomonas syringae group genomosp. 3]|nr:hypothetical protein BKM17_21585 [Pseudomonas syringae group genomosp. 3]